MTNKGDIIKTDFVLKVSPTYFEKNSVSLTYRQYDALLKLKDAGTLRKVKIESLSGGYKYLPLSEFLRSKKVEHGNFLVVKYGKLVQRRNIPTYDTNTTKVNYTAGSGLATSDTTVRVKPSFMTKVKSALTNLFKR